MKVCVPTDLPGGDTAALSPHFGSAPTYTIIDTETKSVSVLENDHHGGDHHHHGGHHDHGHHDHGHSHSGGCGGARQIASKDVEAIVCGGIGRRAMAHLDGVKIYSATSGVAGELAQAAAAGTLPLCTEGCSGH